MVPIPLADADLWLAERIDLGGEDAELLAALVGDCQWQSPTIRLWGKEHRQPRLVAWYGDPGASYRYSGRTYDPLPWTPVVAGLRERVEAASGESFNSVLVNYYRDERDSMGMHSDDEPELGPVVASLSIGQTRRFVMRHRRDRAQKTFSLDLPSASLLVMKPPTQTFWRHGVPKESRPRGPRVNLTFRFVRPGRTG